MKKIIAMLLAVCLMFGTFVMAASAADKVYALTMGVHKYSANVKPSDAAGIATVTYLRHKDGSTGSVNRIYDIEPGEEFTLTAAVNEGKENDYQFIGWLDAAGELIGEDLSIDITMDSSKEAFATFVEIASRHILTYSMQGEGKISVSSDKVMEQGDGCVSLMHEASATIKFTPAEDYSVYYIKLDGKKVTMISNTIEVISDASSRGDIKGIFNAVVNFVKYLLKKEASFTIFSVTEDIDFEVGFWKKVF